MLLHRLPADLLDPAAARPCALLALPRLPQRRWVLPAILAELLVAATLPAALLAPALAPGAGGRTQLLAVTIGSAALFWIVLCANGLTRPLQDRPSPAPVLMAAGAGLAWLAGLGVLLFAADPHLPPERFAAAGAAALLLIAAIRALLHARLRAALRAGACLDRALMLGASPEAARAAAAEVEAATGGRIRVVASSAMPGTPGAPSMAWVEDAIAGEIADRILIAGFDHLPHIIGAVLPRLRALDVDVTLLGDAAALPPIPAVATRLGTLPAIRIAAPPRASRQQAAKRAADLFVAVPALLLLAPLLLIVAAAIRLDSAGPVLFAQPRIGFRGQVFRMLKFRTMFADMTDEVARRQTSRGDARITRVGRVLRRCSLDELPQLLNVLRGEMSIVGPRPHAIGMTVLGRRMDDFVEAYPLRHCVKPGITGWAQINGCRGEVSTETKLRRRLALDCEYIEFWSPAMDLWIMFRTVATLLFDRHAY